MGMPVEIMERLRESVSEACGAEGEHRGDGRMAVGTTVSVRVTPADLYAAQATMKMRVADFSAGGIGLLFGDTIPIGSDVTIHLPKKTDGQFNLRCLVCNCRAVADGVYRIGVRFEGVEA